MNANILGIEIGECKLQTGRLASPLVKVSKCGKIDSYVDDLITVALHVDRNANKAANAVPLALEILGRPVSPQEPVPQDELLSIIKLYAEGAM